MEINTKCIVLGDMGVGKSSLITRYTDNIYIQLDPTIGVDYMVKRAKCGNHQTKIYIWDASGYLPYRSIVRSYYKHVNRVILVFDVTNRDSFDNLDIWVEDVKTHGSQCSMILVANKVDDHGRVISFAQGDEYARKNGMQYIETSAKDDMNIDAIFSHHIHDSVINSQNTELNERLSCSLNMIYEWLLSFFGIHTVEDSE